MKTRLIAMLPFLAAIAGCGLTLSTAAPIPESEVQDFVRIYVSAFNEGDATKVTSMIARNDNATSIAYGEVRRGWEEIRKVIDDQIAAAAVARITVATITVQQVGTDVALAFAPFTITVAQRAGAFQVQGAATLIVRRSAGRLELFHEHYSARIGQ